MDVIPRQAFREELLRIKRRTLDQIAQLDKFATELLGAYEELGDPVTPAPCELAVTAEQLVLGHRMAAAVGLMAPAVACTCPRYPNNQRRETDPRCPLHAGDARD